MYLRYKKFYSEIFYLYILVVIKTQIQLKYLQMRNKININETYLFHTNCCTENHCNIKIKSFSLLYNFSLSIKFDEKTDLPLKVF